MRSFLAPPLRLLPVTPPLSAGGVESDGPPSPAEQPANDAAAQTDPQTRSRSFLRCRSFGSSSSKSHFCPKMLRKSNMENEVRLYSERTLKNVWRFIWRVSPKLNINIVTWISGFCGSDVKLSEITDSSGWIQMMFSFFTNCFSGFSWTFFTVETKIEKSIL